MADTAIQSTSSTHFEQLLTPLRESVINKPPFESGTLKLPISHFSLFYKTTREGHVARHVNFANATSDELEQLSGACEPTTFGLNDKDVMDETYHRAGKMDSGLFSTPLIPDHTDLVKVVRECLLEGTDSTRRLKVELYKLNVYGEGSFFKPHVDTPRSEKMFGSLVLVFPTPHEGGALLVQHHGQEWSFDSAAALAIALPSSIGYAAFFSDIEHEFTPIVSGHHVTLTYNLYFDDNGRAPAGDLVPELASPPWVTNEGVFRAAFEALLANPEFLPDGGTLGFGLRHVYQIEGRLEHVYGLLKGSDGAVYRALRALGFEPGLYLFYEVKRKWSDTVDAGLIDSVVDFEGGGQIEDLIRMLRYHGGIIVRPLDCKSDAEFQAQTVHWITPVTTFNRQSSAYLAYGNEASLGLAYGDVCLIVHIGKVGERLAYPTLEQLRKEWKGEWNKYRYY